MENLYLSKDLTQDKTGQHRTRSWDYLAQNKCMVLRHYSGLSCKRRLSGSLPNLSSTPSDSGVDVRCIGFEHGGGN